MEKIQIQFKESDYKVYYEYCERYYQIHDINRKKSILTFLDLFSKGALPVEEQDISKTILLISQKCEELKKASRSDNTDILSAQLESCTDILNFSRDLEKMYRLFQKQGLVANYYLILGTFSKLTENAKNSPINVMYNLDNETVEILATPLVDLIRARLGTDRDWRSVVKELTVIAARYNRVGTGPKFDLDTIKLVAPAVVYHFNKSVKTSEILEMVPACFEECELDEFETLLNKTSVYVQSELDAEIDWETIAGPLRGIAAKVEEQREQWSRERSNLTDQYALTSGDGAFTGIAPAEARRVFDITTSADGITAVESPLSAIPVIEPDSSEPPAILKLKPHIPMIVGFCVIILFIVGSVILSGAWNPLAGGNTSANASTVKPTVTTAKPVATTAKPGVTTVTTTAKPGTTTVPAATTPKPSVTTLPPAYTSADIGAHLVEIAFGPNNNVIEKPKKDLVAVALQGTQTDADVAFVQDTVKQFNEYATTTKLSENVLTSGRGDITLTFMPSSSLAQINRNDNTTIFKDIPTDTYYFIRGDEGTYINSDLKGNARLHWILRALYFNLGVKGETAKYPDSLFYSGPSDTKQLSSLDLKAVQLMFGKKVTNGMTKATVKNLY